MSQNNFSWGIPGFDGAKGEKGFKGEKGEKGDAGLAGEKGVKGENGINGSQFIFGYEKPSNVFGNNCDIYFDLTNNDSYAKIKNEWIYQTKLKGPKGEKGVKGINGTNGTNGTSGTKGETGEKGKKGIKGETGTKGEIGETGTKGETGQSILGEKGFQGSQVFFDYGPPSPLNLFQFEPDNKSGDIYIDRSTCNIYMKSNNYWTCMINKELKLNTLLKNKKGHIQYNIFSKKTNTNLELVLENSMYPSLPFDCYAMGKLNIIGSSGSHAKINFKIKKQENNYVLTHRKVNFVYHLDDLSPSFSMKTTTNGFTFEIKNIDEFPEIDHSFFGKINLTIIATF